ncbi:PIN domain-containing protein [Quadrisphaera oryzae]|uniref:PIN domain-containing protein n=1 Tax=Quadrisphaera TaxID=317661 RepID=UPI001646619A|nr:PIN domain-containing protein [Quadrisphaera sp. RL12-1S]
MPDVVLDAGALIAAERGSRRLVALLDAVDRSGGSVVVPAGALAQVWRDGARQARLGRLLRARAVVVEPLDESTARAAGALCGRSGTADVVDASVALAAARRGCAVVTSDPEDLSRLGVSAIVL